MEKIKFVYSFVLVLVLEFSLVGSQYVQSPCPGTFDYESDDTGIYGRIVVRPGSPVSQLLLEINFTVTVQLFPNYYGSLELENGMFALTAYNQGSPMRYRVHFPVTSPLPRVTRVAVNGETICSGPGDVPRPNVYLTMFGLEHTTFIGVRPPVNRPRPQNNFGNDFGDSQVYTINGIDNTWTNVNVVKPPEPSRPIYEQTLRPSSPFFGTQNFNDDSEVRPQRLPQRPSQRPPQRLPANRNPNRPVIQQPTLPVYVEPVTQATRPQRPIEEIFYYPEEPVTQAARPVKPRPVNQQVPSSSNIECGVVGGSISIPLIVQGTPYNRGDVPWLVAIYKNTKNDLAFICAGTLVSDRHVITAAHCMHLRSVRTSHQNIVVKIGVYDLSAWEDDITVTRTLMDAKIHESYNSSSLENDILILTLKLPVKFNEYIRPACLWSGDTTLQRIVDTSGIVAGWGDQYNGGPKPGGPKSGVPNLVHLPIVSTDTCRAKNAAFHQLTSSHTLCAGDLGGSGPCKGDSGGGLYIQHEGKWRLRGVVSISLRTVDGGCNLKEYLVFTDTAQYLPWIRQILQAQN